MTLKRLPYYWLLRKDQRDQDHHHHHHNHRHHHHHYKNNTNTNTSMNILSNRSIMIIIFLIIIFIIITIIIITATTHTSSLSRSASPLSSHHQHVGESQNRLIGESTFNFFIIFLLQVNEYVAISKMVPHCHGLWIAVRDEEFVVRNKQNTVTNPKACYLYLPILNTASYAVDT